MNPSYQQLRSPRICICPECAGKKVVKGRHWKKGVKCGTCDGKGELYVEPSFYPERRE